MKQKFYSIVFHPTPFYFNKSHSIPSLSINPNIALEKSESNNFYQKKAAKYKD